MSHQPRLPKIHHSINFIGIFTTQSSHLLVVDPIFRPCHEDLGNGYCFALQKSKAGLMTPSKSYKQLEAHGAN